jgi:hypothetical protein
MKKFMWIVLLVLSVCSELYLFVGIFFAGENQINSLFQNEIARLLLLLVLLIPTIVLVTGSVRLAYKNIKISGNIKNNFLSWLLLFFGSWVWFFLFFFLVGGLAVVFKTY